MRARWLLLLLLCACRKDQTLTHLENAKNARYEKNPDLALVEYKAALDTLERNSSPQTAVYRARALRGAADTYCFELRDFKRAVEVYRELIQTCPEAPETLDGRLHLASLLHEEFHDTRGAIAELTQALARNPPQSAELIYKVATLYFGIQDYQQCQIEADKVVQHFETSSFVDRALFLRGQALAMMEGRSTEAQRIYKDLIERFPESELHSHALLELGRLLSEKGDNEGAIELWVEALKTYPKPAVVQDTIARARVRLKQSKPTGIGDASKAFDWNVPGNMVIEKPLPKTSAEAVGASAEEALKEETMPHEPGARHVAGEEALDPVPAEHLKPQPNTPTLPK